MFASEAAALPLKRLQSNIFPLKVNPIERVGGGRAPDLIVMIFIHFPRFSDRMQLMRKAEDEAFYDLSAKFSELSPERC